MAIPTCVGVLDSTWEYQTKESFEETWAATESQGIQIFIRFVNKIKQSTLCWVRLKLTLWGYSANSHRVSARFSSRKLHKGRIIFIRVQQRIYPWAIFWTPFFFMSEFYLRKVACYLECTFCSFVLCKYTVCVPTSLSLDPLLSDHINLKFSEAFFHY